jgi:hypothetical protein
MYSWKHIVDELLLVRLVALPRILFWNSQGQGRTKRKSCRKQKASRTWRVQGKQPGGKFSKEKVGGGARKVWLPETKQLRLIIAQVLL